MAPEPVTSPERRFVVTRVDNGVETNVIASTPLPINFTTDAPLRSQVYANVHDWLAANPGVHLRLYSPSNGGAHTDGDCIWDSTICEPLTVEVL